MNPAQALHFVFILFLICLSEGQLKIGFYSQTCPKAESIVKSVVQQATLENPRMPPILLRLHFHDCFVEGCDGSILISGPNTERFAFAHQGVEGFEKIEKAKTELESACPGVVSCADIVAMAARDAVALAGGPKYEVETGRRDGRVSSISLADNMPDVNDSIDTLITKFKNKDLTEKELVLLNGAHTIGTTSCFFMPKRLYNFSGRNDYDPEINPEFLPQLQKQCPRNVDSSVRIPLDRVSGDKFDDQILRNDKNGFAVIASDARLYDDVLTKKAVDFYVDGSEFAQNFAVAIVKMGESERKLELMVRSDEFVRFLIKCLFTNSTKLSRITFFKVVRLSFFEKKKCFYHFTWFCTK